MRTLTRIGASTLGAIGVLLCVTALGIGWWTTARTVDRIDRVVARLDGGLAEVDSRLAGVEARAAAIRSEVEDVCDGGEALVADTRQLPRIREAVDDLLDRLGPSLDRAEAIADSMRSIAAAVRAAASLIDQFADGPDPAARARNAADAIDRAAERLALLRERVDGLKRAEADRLIQRVLELTREAVAGIDLLTEGIEAARAELAAARAGMSEYRDAVVLRIYGIASASALALAWAGLGQLCLFDWGRRRFANRSSAPAAT